MYFCKRCKQIGRKETLTALEKLISRSVGMLYSEEQILEVVNKKDKVLYKRLYDTYYAGLCRYAFRLLCDAASEEDVVQDVFVKFWETDTSFKDVRAVTSYLYRAVYNACLNQLRDRKEFSGIVVPPDRLLTNFDATDNERLLIEDEYFRQIYLAIDTLTLHRRQVILKTLEGKRIEQIAEEMNVSVNTIKTLKRKAFDDLRKRLPIPLFVVLFQFV